MTSSFSTVAGSFSVALIISTFTQSWVYFRVIKCNLTSLFKFNTFSSVTIISGLLILRVCINWINWIYLLICKPGFKFVRNFHIWSHVLKVYGSCRFVSTFYFSEDSFISSWNGVTVNMTSVIESSIFCFWFGKLNVWPKYSIVCILACFSSTICLNLIFDFIENHMWLIDILISNNTAYSIVRTPTL